jgi:hypothetical protein
MKHYLENFFAAMKNHGLFLIDSYKTVIFSVLIGAGAWLMEFVQIYIFSDFKYLVFLLLMIAYDAYSGIKRVKYLYEKDPANNPPPSSKVFKDKTFSKLAYYLIVLSSLHGLAHFYVKNNEVTLFHAFEYAALVSIMAAEFWSVQENFAAIGKKGIFLLAWEKLRDYLPANTPKPEL